MSDTDPQSLGEINTTDSGLEVVSFVDIYDGEWILAQSDHIGDYSDAEKYPGSSALAMISKSGSCTKFCLSREQIRKLTNHLLAWLKTGSIDVEEHRKKQLKEKLGAMKINSPVNGNKKSIKDTVRELEKNMQCTCDLDNWEPTKRTGHSVVCQIHKKAIFQMDGYEA